MNVMHIYDNVDGVFKGKGKGKSYNLCISCDFILYRGCFYGGLIVIEKDLKKKKYLKSLVKNLANIVNAYARKISELTYYTRDREREFLKFPGFFIENFISALKISKTFTPLRPPPTSTIKVSFLSFNSNIIPTLIFSLIRVLNEMYTLYH